MTVSPGRVLAMFPLASTMFPGQIVPLHVFEDRYRTMMQEITADGAEETFGIVLIDRGHEVGGGDHRLSVATRVEVVESSEFDDGRWAVIAAGIERLDILEWLEDDPYPRAVVAARSVTDNGGASLDELEELLRETIRLAAAVEGSREPAQFTLSNTPGVRLDQISGLSPLTSFDRQRVLEAATTSEQIELLNSSLDDKCLLLRAQLGGT